MNCYKCGRELPGLQTECEDGCSMADESTCHHGGDEELTQDELDMFCEIDWDKVKTLPDLIAVMKALRMGDGVLSNDPDYPSIRHLCFPPEKERNENE